VEAGLPLHRTTSLTFTTRRAASFDGVHLHLRIQMDSQTALDVREQRTSWSCLYIRLLPAAAAVWLPEGSALAFRCHVDVRGECPHYALEVECAPPGEPLAPVTSFAWSGDG